MATEDWAALCAGGEERRLAVATEPLPGERCEFTAGSLYCVKGDECTNPNHRSCPDAGS